MDDSDIIELYVSRDERTVAETDASYGVRLMKLAMRILGDRGDSEECQNDTYLRAWNSIPPTIPQFLYAYLAKICRFLALNRLEMKKAKKRSMQLVELTREMEQCIPNRNSETNITATELGEIFSSFLTSQPQSARMVFIRRYFYGETAREIALRYEMNEANVRKILQRTRNKLKRYLEQEGVGL